MTENKSENHLTLTKSGADPLTYVGECDKKECNFRGSTDCHSGMYIGNSYLFQQKNLPPCGRAVADGIKEWTFVEGKGLTFTYKIDFEAPIRERAEILRRRSM